MQSKRAIIVTLGVLMCATVALAVITVNIGGSSRLTSLSRQRDRYNCFWDCDLVGCQIDSDDDECAYDCEKICRPRYDWARSAPGANELTPKAAKAVKVDNTAPSGQISYADEDTKFKIVDGETVRLHLPRNATARKFAIMERCSSDPDETVSKDAPVTL